jgi:hypothetical protein
VYSYSNAVYENLRFDAVNSDSIHHVRVIPVSQFYIYTRSFYMTLSFFLGLEMGEGEVAVANESAFQNSYWKADEAGKLIMQRGARGIYR